MKKFLIGVFINMVFCTALAFYEYNEGYSAAVQGFDVKGQLKKDSAWIDSALRVKWTQVCNDSIQKWDSINKLYER